MQLLSNTATKSSHDCKPLPMITIPCTQTHTFKHTSLIYLLFCIYSRFDQIIQDKRQSLQITGADFFKGHMPLLTLKAVKRTEYNDPDQRKL